MPPLTYDEAYAATNPNRAGYNLPDSASDDELEKRRDESARRILAGAAANAAYWDSRSPLDALKAQAEGHGVIVRGEDPEPPTAVAAPMASAGAIESTAVEEPETAPDAAPADNPPAAPGTVPGTDRSESPEDKLRAQLRAAGIEPEV